MNMTKSSDKVIVPKLPPYADHLLFAKDLVDYVMLHHCLNYIVEKESITLREYAYSAFNENTKRAVCFIAKYIKKNDITFRNIENRTVVSEANYTRLAESLSSRYFDESFDVKLFLFYCVRISVLASIYFNRGISNAPVLAKCHIISVLHKYYKIVGVWHTLNRICESLKNMQRVNVMIFKYTNDSEEIDLLNQIQDEVCVDEANSSSKNQIMLSKDEENKVERQEERPHSEKELSLKESAQVSTESISEIVLRPFKSPDTLQYMCGTVISAAIYLKSSKGCVQRLGLPNTYQKLNLVENGLKSKNDLVRNETTSRNSQLLEFEISQLFNKLASYKRPISDLSNACQNLGHMSESGYKLTIDWMRE